jgi:hypothetical protein
MRENLIEAFARVMVRQANEASGPYAGALGKARGHALPSVPMMVGHRSPLDGAFNRNPERFVRKEPEPPAKPTATWINPPQKKLNIEA